MISNDLYRAHQSAYRSGHSTETALLKIMDDLLWAMDNQQCSLLVLLDQSAAFDTVNQELLLNRLQTCFGVSGSALNWLRSYFKGRSQHVTIGQSSSDPHELVTGFPQGSVLGPFAYPIYTSPLFDTVTRHGISIHMYADDTQIYVSFRSTESSEAQTRLHAAIGDVRKWMETNHLKLNDSKTEFMVIASPHSMKHLSSDLTTLRIGNSSVDAAHEARNIGVILDSHLSMKQQVASVCRSCYVQMHNIAKKRAYMTEETAEKMVNALVTSRLDYANALLYGLPDYLTDKLQVVQNNAARLILKKKKHDNATPLLKYLHWLPVKYRIEYKMNLLTFKSLRGDAPVYLSDLLKEYVPSRLLRSASSGLLDESKTGKKKCGDRAFSVAAPRLWNSLPEDLRDIQELTPFKSALKTFYFKKAFN